MGVKICVREYVHPSQRISLTDAWPQQSIPQCADMLHDAGSIVTSHEHWDLAALYTSY